MSKETKVKVVHSNAKWLHRVTRFLVILIAAGAGILSFDGLAQLAVAAGIRPELSFIWALVIDGFILVATFATYVLKDRTEEERIKKYYAWFVLAVFVIISIFGNALHTLPSSAQELPTWVKICVNGIPPIAFFLAGHLIIIMVSPTAEEKKAKIAADKKKEREARISDKKLQVEENRAERELRQAEKAIDQPIKPSTSRPRRTNQAKETPNVESSTPTLEMTSEPPILNTPSTTTEQPQEPLTLNEGVTPLYTKDEAVEKLIELQRNGEPFPTAKVVGDWVGLKERSGANLIKRAKDEAALMEESSPAR